MESAEIGVNANRRKTAVGAFVSALLTGARTAMLYKPGHQSIMAVAERVRELLSRTLAGETTLTLGLKAKSVTLDDLELDETAETVGFASSLHTLGIGQVLFTDRLSAEGMRDFFGVLTAKPEDGKTLSDLQKEVQLVRIDGLQMVFILSFVVTGEDDKAEQDPGQFTDQQLQALIGARTLGDFTALWLAQTTPLRGKQAEAVAELLDGLLYREISLEKFAEALPWTIYDPRLQQRWEQLREPAQWGPKGAAPHKRWSAGAASSWASTRTDYDFVALRSHETLEKPEAMRRCLEQAQALLDHAPTPSHRKYAALAYARLIGEFGRDGGFAVLLAERPRWPAACDNRADPDWILREQLKEELTVARVAEGWADLASRDESVRESLVAFAEYLGEPLMPLLVERLREAADKDARLRLCSALAAACRRLGDAAVVAAVGDPDWFLASHAVAILHELGDPNRAKEVAPVLKHSHRKAREAAMRFLAKVGGEAAVSALAAFSVAGAYPEEIDKAVIVLSLVPHPAVRAKLIDGYHRTTSYQSRVAIARALSRFPGPDTVNTLKEAARRTWYEILSGAKNELHEAAKHSLEALKKEGAA
jgi:hypothetical protein